MLRKQILLLGNKKCFCHGVKNIFASRTQMLRPKHMFPSLATPGNITRNIVSATMFPSLARPLNSLKMKNARAKRAKILFFIFKYANSWGVCCRRRELIGHVKNRIQYKSAIMSNSPRNFYSLIQILNLIKMLIYLCLLNVKLSFSISQTKRTFAIIVPAGFWPRRPKPVEAS